MTVDGTSYIDFTSQLVNVNMGYKQPKLVAAIQEQAGRLMTVSRAMANDMRSEAARVIAEVAPDGMNMVFFTNGGAEANENAIRMARLHTARHKVLAAYRSYHGATHGAITLTGEPRRFGSEPGIPGVVHFFGPTSIAAPSTPPPRRRKASGRCSICARSWSPRGRTRSPRSSSRPSSAPTAS